MVRLLIVYTISTFVVLAGVLFGFDISSISGVVGTDQYRNFFGDPLGTRQGGITSGMAAGSLVGALSSSFLWCIGAATQSASNGVAMLIAGRIVSGVCIGLTSSLVPIYQSEIAPHKIRGRIIVFQTLAITAGIMIQYFIQYGCSFIDSEAAFRIPWAIQAILAIFLIIGLFWLPRSPVLAYLRTGIGDINDPLVLAEYKEIEDQISTEREENSNSYRELFSRMS
ncbi:general substrate transporter [Lipomyces tetrasporus]|uniref:General substrate transporter n=1 Tax=Lipomyces tetrasporus TaxID=54092 RepID=A0AAD7VPK7_9ASCO|nr:general substrate transporter [Lipomyces tetrasporus]KAJ8096549.1 general substrate transporter [Lipomyces tetrasporus]